MDVIPIVAAILFERTDAAKSREARCDEAIKLAYELYKAYEKTLVIR
jgi:hypothetical protein